VIQPPHIRHGFEAQPDMPGIIRLNCFLARGHRCPEPIFAPNPVAAMPNTSCSRHALPGFGVTDIKASPPLSPNNFFRRAHKIRLSTGVYDLGNPMPKQRNQLLYKVLLSTHPQGLLVGANASPGLHPSWAIPRGIGRRRQKSLKPRHPTPICPVSHPVYPACGANPLGAGLQGAIHRLQLLPHGQSISCFPAS
jgi:hypothetical protein